MHLGDPVAQAVLNETADGRLVGVQRVAATGVVGVPGAIRVEDVIEVVGQAAIAGCRAVRAALGRVVVDHVEDHLDAGAMKGLDHVAELVEHGQRRLAGAVGVMRREERDRLIAPVVHPAAWRVLRIELEDRQQLDGRDAQILQIGNLVDEPGVRASLPRRDTRARVPGEAAHVQLVDDRFRERPPQRCVAFPVVTAGIRDHALHRTCDVVAGAARGAAAVVVGHRHRQAVRIEQHLLRIESEPAFRRGCAVGAVRVDLSCGQAGHERMPVVIRAVGSRIERDRLGGLGRLRAVEQQELDQVGVLGEHAEVDAARGRRGAERRALARRDRVAVERDRSLRMGLACGRRRAPRPARAHRESPDSAGVTCQISRQYSRIDRSDEKRPTRAAFRIDLRVQASSSRNCSPTRCCASRYA